MRIPAIGIIVSAEDMVSVLHAFPSIELAQLLTVSARCTPGDSASGRMVALPGSWTPFATPPASVGIALDSEASWA